MKTVLASSLKGIHDLQVDEKVLPPPAKGEVQVAIRATTICGSDVHYYNHFRNGDFAVKEPLTLGHESSGKVVAIGEGVENLRVGDRVAIEVGIPCLVCHYCRIGRYNLCKKVQFKSSAKLFPHAQGTLQTVINHPADWCFRLPGSVSYLEGALVEPLAVAMHAANRSGIKPGDRVLVFGAGAVGLLACAVARAHGASRIIVADIVSSKIGFAIENGFADAGYLVTPASKENWQEETATAAEEILKQLCEPNGVDVCFECTGFPSSIQTCIYASAPGGCVMLIGMGVPVATLHLASAALREIDLKGVFRYANTYETSIKLIASGGLNKALGNRSISSIISHKVTGIEKVGEAFEIATGSLGKDELVVKVAIEFPELKSEL